MAKEAIAFKGISTFSSGSYFAQQNRMVCAILLEGNMSNISENFFKIWSKHFINLN